MLLFGGAAAIDLPEKYIDVSDFRQVPDNQEAFVERRGDASVVIEVVQPPGDAAERCQDVEYYLWDLVTETGPDGASIHEHDRFETSVGPQAELRDAQVTMLHAVAKDGVDLKMALIRIPSVDADLLITLSRGGSVSFGAFAQLVRTFRLDSWDLFL